MSAFIATFLHDLKYVLTQGEPPLYMQLALATALFLAVRLYLFLRRRRHMSTPRNEWITGGYLVLMMLLSFGAWDAIYKYYDEYAAPMLMLHFG